MVGGRRRVEREEAIGREGERCNFVFFKQRTAYEMLRGLVGSEMCIRDRAEDEPHLLGGHRPLGDHARQRQPGDQLHDEVCRAVVFAVVVDGRDVGVGPVSYTHLTLPTIYPV